MYIMLFSDISINFSLYKKPLETLSYMLVRHIFSLLALLNFFMTMTFILFLVSLLQDLVSLAYLIDVSDDKYKMNSAKNKHHVADPSIVVPFYSLPEGAWEAIKVNLYCHCAALLKGKLLGQFPFIAVRMGCYG